MRFRLREADWRDMYPPGQLLFEVVDGNMTSVYYVTPGDIANLSGLTFHYNAGARMPLETPETS